MTTRLRLMIEVEAESTEDLVKESLVVIEEVRHGHTHGVMNGTGPTHEYHVVDLDG